MRDHADRLSQPRLELSGDKQQAPHWQASTAKQVALDDTQVAQGGIQLWLL